jgi:hypothetical protein
MNGGHEHTRERESVEFFDEVEDELGVDASPTVGQDLSTAHIGGDDDTARKETRHLREPIWVFKRTRTDDHPLRTIVERALNQVPASYPASELHLDVGGSENSLDFRSIIATSGYGIKVDHMKMPESVLPPGQGNPDRIRNSDDFLIVGSGGKLNTGPSSQVKRRNCDHLSRVSTWIGTMSGEGAELIACWRACE